MVNVNKWVNQKVYQFFHEDINKFVLLFRKGLSSHEYMDSLERHD